MEKEKEQKKDLHANKKLMLPEEYLRLLKGFEIKDICLTSSTYSIDKNKITENKQTDIDLHIEIEASFKLSETKKEAIFYAKNYLFGKIKNEDPKIIEIRTTFELFFSSSEEINNEFLNIYNDVSLPLNVVPYFREFVQNLTQRSGVRPIVLPLMKLPGKPIKKAVSSD
ncbi:MAG: hypothetical protein PHE84_12090 [bacterium]|nr:hypothetical protein [bacterium]